MNEYPISMINRVVPSKADLYNILSNNPEFELKLPAYSSKAITIAYLMSVANGNVFSIKKSAYREWKAKTYLSKIDYFAELSKISNNIGFDLDSLPDKKWLKNVFFSLNPDHDFFKKQPANTIQIPDR